MKMMFILDVPPGCLNNTADEVSHSIGETIKMLPGVTTVGVKVCSDEYYEYVEQAWVNGPPKGA